MSKYLPLINRLKPKHKETLKNDDTALSKRVVRILEDNKFFIDLTIDQCITLCLVILKSNFIKYSQITDLFD